MSGYWQHVHICTYMYIIHVHVCTIIILYAHSNFPSVLRDILHNIHNYSFVGVWPNSCFLYHVVCELTTLSPPPQDPPYPTPSPNLLRH